MKKYLTSAFVTVFAALTVFGTTASAAVSDCGGQLCRRSALAVYNAACSARARLAECPNSGTPALDGTGYRGGKTGGAPCVVAECPNGGAPALDGTGYRGGKTGGAPCVAGKCPNGGRHCGKAQ